MRPVVVAQNSLRYPLNELLGTESHIRILRVLANDVDGPVTAPNAAERTGLTIPGTHQALKRLVKSGFVVRVGSGRRHLYALNRSDKMIKALLRLFQAEANRYEALLDAIKKELEKPTPYPRSAWIQELPDEYGDPLVIGVLHETKRLANYIHRLRTHLNRVERTFDITIEIKGYTKADIPDLGADKVTLLFGIMPFPDKYSRELHTKPSTHQEKDRQMLALSHQLAEAIENDPSLVRRAKEHVLRMLKNDHGSATQDIEEWRNILESYSIRRLSRFLTSTSERANRLRQSNPLFAILSTEERYKLLNT